MGRRFEPDTGHVTAAETAELLALLHDWMPAQRWFAAKDLTVSQLRNAAQWPLTSAGPTPQVIHLIVEVGFVEGSAQIYQVPVAIYRPPAQPDGAVLIGALDDGSQVVDALTDPGVMASMVLDLSTPAVLDPDLTHAEPTPPQLQSDQPVPSWGRRSARAMSVEQSNTSYVLDETVLLKWFRHLAPGINPDIEVHAALGRAGSDHIGRVRAWVNGCWEESGPGASATRHTGHLAMVQDLLTPARDGWELACQRAAEGISFADEARSLGVATAEVHRDLRRVLPTHTVEGAELAALVERLGSRLDAVVASVPELAPMADRLRARIQALGEVPDGLLVQRVHGDYHLGQVLLVGDSWKLLDFEGEPGAPIDERAAPDHPLRDVAGMLRSFAYAAAQGGAQRSAEERTGWQHECERAFREGYAAALADEHDEPVADASTEAILSAYLVDKAAYEADYERRYRPDWLPIPMVALSDLAG